MTLCPSKMPDYIKTAWRICSTVLTVPGFETDKAATAFWHSAKEDVYSLGSSVELRDVLAQFS